MSTLSKELGRQLENTVLKARDEAERGAAAALEELGLSETKIPTHLNEAQQKLRRKLRAHGKQVGDTQISDKAWDISHLIHECAYEHWHRMLFARFLAENGCLIEPESGLDVDFAHCEDEGNRLGIDPWEVAAGYAQKMLLDVFRSDDPVLQLRLPRETRNALTGLLTSLPREVFLASDSLGWVYQFWQAKKKEEVNAAGNKIGADELPSVTQLFTEDYMVDFLLDNTLGAWWAGKEMKRMKAETEEEARAAVALPGCPWKYLRFIKAPAGEAADPLSSFSLHNSSFSWTPAAGTFSGWPKTAAALRALDPCMGSGHFVVAMFERLVALRLAEEKLDEAAAVAAVIRDNLFGLEIDPRCTQIGAFNLALAAWRRVGHCKLPAMNLACSGLAPNTKLEDWLAIVDAASSRMLNDKQKRQDAASTFPPITCFRPDEPVANLTGNLPHWRQEGTTYFVTFRCADALPQEKLKQWQYELEQWLAAHPEPHDETTRQEFYERFPQRIQAWLDSGYGGCVLCEPAMREIVESALRHFDGQRYRLGGFVVAGNHVHALVTPLGEHLLSDILHSWKSFTANKINETRGESGAFWQKESFDHIVRSPASLAKFREYILAHSKVAAASSRSSEEEQRLEAAATMRLRAGMERLYRLFQKAAVLGSLINPRVGEGDLLVAEFHELKPFLAMALKVEEASSLSSQALNQVVLTSVATASNPGEAESLEGSATFHEMAVTARGLAKAAEILAGQFTLVATNVPYLGRGNQDDVLKDYCDRVYPESKADLATCFVERCVEFAESGNSTALVTPQSWLFMGTYKKLGAKILTSIQWDTVGRLGPRAFETISGEVVNVALLGFSRARPDAKHTFAGIDVAEEKSAADKAEGLRLKSCDVVLQSGQTSNPDSRISFNTHNNAERVSKYASSFLGLGTGDYSHYGRCFWEFPQELKEWAFQQCTVESPMFWGGREHMIAWDRDAGRVRGMTDAERVQIDNQDQSGQQAWGRKGVAVGLMQDLRPTLYTGETYEKALAVLLPQSESLIPALWAYCSDPLFNKAVRELEHNVIVANGTLVKVPFDLAHWQKVAAEKYPDGLPKPFSSDPTQWLFNGHPKQIVAEASSLCSVRLEAAATFSATLHVAVARLLGYQWPRKSGSSFPDCPALGPDGLEKHADKDGVVCFSQVRDEPPAATRLRALLANAYSNVEAASSRCSEEGKSLEGSSTIWSHAMERKLIAVTGSKADSLEDWLLNDFFAQHCDLFHNRPFVWHLWDGRKDGFNVLVNYHKLCGSDSGSGFHPLNSKSESEAGSLSHSGRRTLETLAYAYLGDWITRQKDAVAHGEAGADDRLAAALELQGELKKIVAGEPPYDLFICWKPLHLQPEGWHPDINDGVRLNIRPFMVATLSRGKKGCGLFRAKPGTSVKWDKDRGKEPSRPMEDFPWFWNDGTFTGDRVNDVHLTHEQKRKARENQGSSNVGK